MTRHQSELSPRAERKASPVTSTEAELPTRRARVTRPPSAPRLLRLRISTRCKGPIVGQAAATLATSTWVTQSWRALQRAEEMQTASPSSTTAGNVPPAVQPPVEEENSVRATAP